MNLWDWKRITPHVWRRDGTWQVVEETPGQWRAYRDNKPLLADFPRPELAMAECERLREADKLYAPPEGGAI